MTTLHCAFKDGVCVYCGDENDKSDCEGWHVSNDHHRIKALTAERDAYQQAALNTAANYKAENDRLMAEIARPESTIVSIMRAERDALMAAGKLALEACVGFSRAPMTQVEYLSLLRVIAALREAGVG